MSSPETIEYRKLWPREAAQFRDHLMRLDANSRRLRFGGAVSQQFVENYAQTAWKLDAVILGCFAGGTLRGSAEMRLLTENWASEAEVAFAVEQPWQERGIGGELLRRTIGHAQNRAVRTLYMICLNENIRMQHLARHHEAKLQLEPGSMAATLDPAWPTPGSVMEEFMEESRGFVTAVLNV